MTLKIVKLNLKFGIEVKDFDLSNDINDVSFKEIFEAFNNFAFQKTKTFN
jgi:hypothetical protein